MRAIKGKPTSCSATAMSIRRLKSLFEDTNDAALWITSSGLAPTPVFIGLGRVESYVERPIDPSPR